MIEIRQPKNLDIDSFVGAVHSIRSDAVERIERRNKGNPDLDKDRLPLDHYVCLWNENVIRPPTLEEIDAAAIQYRRRKLTELVRQEAALRRNLMAFEESLERREAQIAEMMTIVTKVVQGIAAKSGFDAVAEGVIGQNEKNMLDTILERTEKMAQVNQAEAAIVADVADDKIPDAGAIGRDTRWPTRQ